MRIVVVGAGEVGYHVAERLSNQQHDVVVVDVMPSRLEYVSNHLDVAVVEGSGTSTAVLEQAGVQKAALLLAVTNVDEVNLVSCMSARGVRGMVKVARVSNPDFYRDTRNLKPDAFGVDVLINPERELSLETVRLLQSTAATDIAVFAGGAVQLLGFHVPKGAPIAGQRLAELAAQEGDRPILLVALERAGETIVPNGGTEIRVGDRLYVAAKTEEIPRALELLGYERSSMRRVIITGGTVEAYYLAQLLQEHHVETTLLIGDRARAQELAAQLNHVLVLHGDATDVELLELEGVGGADGFVALTDRDETNILSSLVAKRAGAKQVITLVNKRDFIPLARHIGLDAAVSPRLSAANAILRYVRRGSVTRVATFEGSDAEAIAFEVASNSPVVGRRLADVAFPSGAIVASIIRAQEVIVPRGNDVLEVGDTAIVFVLADAAQSITELFPS
jgi:trk system potassium uptake protein TrkA